MILNKLSSDRCPIAKLDDHNSQKDNRRKQHQLEFWPKYNSQPVANIPEATVEKTLIKSAMKKFLGLNQIINVSKNIHYNVGTTVLNKFISDHCR